MMRKQVIIGLVYLSYASKYWAKKLSGEFPELKGLSYKGYLKSYGVLSKPWRGDVGTA